MPLHDVQCSKCGEIIINHFVSPWPKVLLHGDGGELEILWRSTPRSATVHPQERIVVYRHPRTGAVAYPPTNGPITKRYADAGYERVEFTTRREAEAFERERGVTNEKLWYNSGNGV